MEVTYLKSKFLLLALCLLLIASPLSGCESASAEAVQTMAHAEELSGENEYPIGEYSAYDGRIFKAKLFASLSDQYIGPYAALSESHLALTLTDWLGRDTLPAYVNRASSEGRALSALLSGGGTAKVTLRIKLLTTDSGEPAARVVELLSEGWEDTEPYNPELVEAVRSGAYDEVLTLYSEGASLDTRDENGDGLLYHALRGGHTELASWLVGSGVSCANRNCYYYNYDYLTHFEIDDLAATVQRIISGGGSIGCADESLLGYFVAMGRDSAVEFLLALNNFDPNAHSLSLYSSGIIAEQYGVDLPENSAANILDIAVTDDNPRVAQRLMESGVQPSPLLLSKVAQRMDFSRQMTALLGDYRFFGLLEGVSGDYLKFRNSYSGLMEPLYGFTDTMELYSSLYAEGRIFDANFLFSTKLTPASDAQEEALVELVKPETPEILAIYENIAEYVDISARAARQLRLVNESMTKTARRIHFANFDTLEADAAVLRQSIDSAVRYYDLVSSYLD